MPVVKKDVFEELYEKLVDEILSNEIPRYDNLVIFVDKLLKATVKYWCDNDKILRGGCHDEDVIQEIQIRIIKKCEDYFFKPENGKTQKTCDEFKAWCYVVGENVFFTYRKRKIGNYVGIDTDIGTEDLISDNDDIFNFVENAEKSEYVRYIVNICFNTVFDLKSNPHIVLTWLALSLFMLTADADKISSTHLVVEELSDFTLFKMFNLVLMLIKNYDWICISDEQISVQRKNLEKNYKQTDKKIGEMKYEEFYQTKGPEASISDWANRVNSQIKKRISLSDDLQ